MAELAIWMAGYTTVAIFPTETAETINYVLTHSEASLLFVGKLDTWPHQQPRRAQGHALRRLSARTEDRVRHLGRDRRAHAAAAGPADAQRRRTGDADLHVRFDRHAEGRDDHVRRLHARRRRHRGRSGAARRRTREPHAVLPAAGAQFRTHRGRKARRWSTAACTSSSPSRSTPSSRTCSARSRRCSCRCRGCGSSSSRACSPRCRRPSSSACSASRSSARSSRRRCARDSGSTR